MPLDVHAALTTATTAAAHLREGLANLARVVAENEPAAIVVAARALVARDDALATTGPDSPDRLGTEAGSQLGESS